MHVLVCFCMYVCVFGMISYCSAVVHVQVVHFAMYFSCFFQLTGMVYVYCHVMFSTQKQHHLCMSV